MNKVIHLFLVSDSSGETALTVSRAAMAQFEGLEVIEHSWPLIRKKEQIEELFQALKKHDGIVLYTMVNKELRHYLKEGCNKLGIKYISVIAHVINELSEYLNIQADIKIPGAQHSQLDPHYFKRISAIEYTLKHDDGQNLSQIDEADIVLLGVSRTSKTPTSFYLAQRGLKVANIPIINNSSLPFEQEILNKKNCIALTIRPEKLSHIRNNRLLHLMEVQQVESNEYTELDAINAEIKYALKLFAQFKIPVIDISNKAIEETAAEIIILHSKMHAPQA